MNFQVYSINLNEIKGSSFSQETVFQFVGYVVPSDVSHAFDETGQRYVSTIPITESKS